MFPTWLAGDCSAGGAARSRRGLFALVLVCALAALPAARPAFAKPDPFQVPPALERDVQFWIRVYTQIDTNSGFLHDENDLSVIYETLHFPPDASRRQRERIVEAARDHYVAVLKRLATSGPQTAEDRRVRRLWGEAGTPIRLLDATDHIRFQLGQADRFRAGLERAGRWETDIAETFANLGLPPELAVLPHVESSFNPVARSKVGAAGLWQFMRSTGRRYMRIDSTVDDRFDPFQSTAAAAQLLAYNYRLLGTWPLAITAYNHGAAGMRRAVETLGTEDIVTILRDYKSPSFGFASRNFYVSFLAALAIDRDPQKYFGHIRRDPEVRFQEVALPVRTSLIRLERSLHVDAATLRELNPALRPVCWRGRRDVPKGYRLRLPLDGTHWTSELIAHDLRARAPHILLASDLAPRRRRASRSATLASATPAAPPGHANPAATAGAVSPETAEMESEQDAQAVASIARPASKAQPVSAAQAEALGPALGPDAVEPTATADPTDYSVAKNDTIVVAAAETLGHYAEWLHVSAWHLRRLNHMRYGRPVVMGHRIRLDFRRVSPETFEATRRAYHRALEASYFAAHRIAGTQVYIVRPGDSLWTVTERHQDLPIWLLQQYNPDMDFSAMRPGAQIVVPRIRDVASAGS